MKQKKAVAVREGWPLSLLSEEFKLILFKFRKYSTCR